jgi:hypothetical protein
MALEKIVINADLIQEIELRDKSQNKTVLTYFEHRPKTTKFFGLKEINPEYIAGWYTSKWAPKPINCPNTYIEDYKTEHGKKPKLSKCKTYYYVVNELYQVIIQYGKKYQVLNFDNYEFAIKTINRIKESCSNNLITINK